MGFLPSSARFQARKCSRRVLLEFMEAGLVLESYRERIRQPRVSEVTTAGASEEIHRKGFLILDQS